MYHLLTGVGRHDNVHAIWIFECLLNGIEEKGVNGIDSVKHHLVVKAKGDLEMLFQRVTY